MPSLTLLAPAKINLGLRVLRKRPDGYHDVESVFVAVDLCDELVVSPSETLNVECEPMMTERAEDNLVHKAALVLKSAANAPELAAKIHVLKRIPSGAGLGGGSSDAAATLRGLDAFWGLGLGTSALLSLAAKLGSDVPFFISNTVALVTGRGEIIHPLDIHIPWIIVLVCSDIHISTPEAYAALDRYPHRTTSTQTLKDTLVELVANHDSYGVPFSADVQNELRNDFQPVMEQQYPILATIRKSLVDNGAAFSSLTGSGSTVYGLFTDVDTAREAASAQAPYHTTYICRPMNRGAMA